jgi:hypothetical protein
MFSRDIDTGTDIKPLMSKFSAPGDSGAFIFEIKGEVAGLLHGELTGRCGPPALSSGPAGSTVASRAGLSEEHDLYDGAGLRFRLLKMRIFPSLFHRLDY